MPSMLTFMSSHSNEHDVRWLVTRISRIFHWRIIMPSFMHIQYFIFMPNPSYILFEGKIQVRRVRAESVLWDLHVVTKLVVK
jgi:hypothetical protein